MRGDWRALSRARAEGEGVRCAGARRRALRSAGHRTRGPHQACDRPVQISARDRVRRRAPEDRDRQVEAERVAAVRRASALIKRSSMAIGLLLTLGACQSEFDKAKTDFELRQKNGATDADLCIAAAKVK